MNEGRGRVSSHQRYGGASAAGRALPGKRRNRRVPLTVVGLLLLCVFAAVRLEATGQPPAVYARTGVSVTTNPMVLATSGHGSAGAAAPSYPTLPGIGTRFGSRVPAKTSQVVIAYGDGVHQYTTTVDFFQKDSAGWELEGAWQGHNGFDGWTTRKISGDLKSPIGVFSLTDAGGKLPEPAGTKLRYQRSHRYVNGGKGFFGESLHDVFDYVIAINYNRTPGTPPLSNEYPLGAGAGTGVWLHVDHGGPTHACVSIPEEGMRTLLENLNPADDPVIIMGDRGDLASG